MKHNHRKNNGKCSDFTKDESCINSICPKVLKNEKADFKGCKHCGYALTTDQVT